MLTCWLATTTLANEHRTVIANFDGPSPLSGWNVSGISRSPGTPISLKIGPGHAGLGAELEYDFACNAEQDCSGSVTAIWTPAKPFSVKHDGAFSLWIRAGPEVKLTFLLSDQSAGTHRYPFETATIGSGAPGQWRQILIPFAATSTGYWDEDHNGGPEGKVTSIGIMAESRYPAPIRGSIGIDDMELLESADQVLQLEPDSALMPAPPDSGSLRSRLGVNIQTLGDARALDVIRDAGFSFVRADLLWRQVERNGQFRFRAQDRLLAALEARRMGVIWILDYGHPEHGGDPPRNPDDVSAFARFAEAAAGHFKGHDVRYEVWNEPDTERFWPPKPDPGEYVALLESATRAIHRADAAALVASGGLSRIDLPFFGAMLRAGTAPVGLNAVAVHPYRRLPPESLAAESPLLRRMVTDGVGENAAIWDTEWGYASYDYFSKNLSGDGHSESGRKRQAVLACREALSIWALGLPVAVWYDFRDDGDDPRNPEHNYGLLTRQNVEKPVLVALRTLAGIADGRTFVGMVRDVPDGMYAMRLDGHLDRVYVLWTEQPDSRTTARFSSMGLISASNLMGEPLKLRNKGGKQVEIGLSETDGPVYIRFTP
jgi:polysaccharide biosynthesis protein PslG